MRDLVRFLSGLAADLLRGRRERRPGWSGEDPVRIAAVKAESNEWERAILASVADAVTFAVRYLGAVGFATSTWFVSSQKTVWSDLTKAQRSNPLRRLSPRCGL
jgi:hypothetical protein